MSVAMPSADPTSHRDIPCAPAPSPRLKQEGLTDADRNFAVAMHLAPLAASITGIAIFVPLILWFVRKDESVFDDDHGREVVNFLISFILLHVILIVSVIGIIMIPVLWIVGIVNMIRGAVSAGRGEYFRYPMNFRLIS